MADAIDSIKKVIQRSTSDMSIDSLTKRGVKQVKVLDQETVTRLISEVIDKVLAERSERVNRTERERIIAETKAQLNVDSLKKGIQAANDEIAHKDRRIAELQGLLEAKEEELQVLRSQADGGLSQVLALLESGASSGGGNLAKAIEALTRKVESMSMGGGGGGGRNAPVPDEIALDFLVKQGDSLESNLDDVKVKQAKAGDVKGALAKLKKLQKGGE
jgi:hypothetical protein